LLSFLQVSFNLPPQQQATASKVQPQSRKNRQRLNITQIFDEDEQDMELTLANPPNASFALPPAALIAGDPDCSVTRAGSKRKIVELDLSLLWQAEELYVDDAGSPNNIRTSGTGMPCDVSKQLITPANSAEGSN